MNILIRIPAYSKGNIGDAALINTIKDKLKNDNLIIPLSNKELNSINLKNIDYMIYFGNDCIAYYDISKSVIQECLNNKKKVHIINTSWGNNVIEENVTFIKSVANDKNFQIYMRDKYSHELIKKNIQFYNTPIFTADLGFLCEKNEKNRIDKLEDWIDKNDIPIIGINNHKDFKEYNKYVEDELINFITTNKNKYRYLFIPHDSRKKEYEDLQKLQNLCKGIDGYTTTYLEPEYEKHITSKLYLVITGRMHLSILTIPNNIPSIAISYNGIKAKGSFEHWGIDNLVLEPKNIKDLQKLVNHVENDYTNIQNQIENSKSSVYGLINETYKNLKM